MSHLELFFTWKLTVSNLFQPIFYLALPVAFLLMLWQMNPYGSSYLGNFASRFFDNGNQFDSFDYGPSSGGGPSSGITFSQPDQNDSWQEPLEI